MKLIKAGEKGGVEIWRWGKREREGGRQGRRFYTCRYTVTTRMTFALRRTVT